MSGTSDSKTGNRGDLIRPSARPSIHNRAGTTCVFEKREEMPRYEQGKNQRARREHAAGDNSLEGIDEVDNVMSKLASSPISTRKYENIRRNSLILTKNTDDSDEDSRFLSKSLPATLSTYSYCSEELEEINRTCNSSANSSSSQNRLPMNTASVHNTPSYSPQTESRRLIENVATERSTIKNWNPLFHWSLIVTVVAIIIWYGNLFTSGQETKSVIYDKFSFYNDIKGVGEKYKISDNSILKVRTGISTIFERQDTGSFIFAYNGDKTNFNPVNFNNFINDISLAAARYLRNDTTNIHHVVVDPTNLKMQTDKELMNEYLAEVDKTGVMLVKDLDRVPSSLAMAFHYYCDEYNPLVKRSAIFFTLNMARCSAPNEKYTHENIEKCLISKWNKMSQDNIKPLLTRVVNVIIDVTNDF